MEIISYQLTMPNVGSWNGQWTGSAKKYFVIKKYKNDFFKKTIEPLLGDRESRSFYYNFGDGWGANVIMEVVDSQIAQKRIKESSGFCGYEWMIDSIIKNGKIIVE